MGSIVLIVTGTVQIITLLLVTVTLLFRNTGKIQKTFAEITVHITPGIQVFVPQGVCNGFQALEEGTEYLYFFDNEWAPGMSGTALTPLDNELGIEWPIPIEKDNREQLSEKDAKAPTLRKLKEILKCE